MIFDIIGTIFIIAFFILFLCFIWRTEHVIDNGKGLKNKEYRIKKVLYNDGNTVYYIQWKRFLFWYNWRVFIGIDTMVYLSYDTEEEAKKALFKIVAEDKPKPKPLLTTYPLKITNE